MRAGTWSANRDLAAARVSWDRARRIADAVPDDDPDHLAMRVSPPHHVVRDRLAGPRSPGQQASLRGILKAVQRSGDKVSLAIGMSALATELVYAGRSREGAELASNRWSCSSRSAISPGRWHWCRWRSSIGCARGIRRDLAVVADRYRPGGHDPGKGAGFGLGSPLAIALAWRGTARWWFGHPEWRQDLRDAVAMAQCSNAETPRRCGRVDLRVRDAVRGASGYRHHRGCGRGSAAGRTAGHQRSGDGPVGYTLAVALLNRDSAADRDRGLRNR